ncbi:MAG TPA: 50S ribosomal protein L11 methyltransferase [Chitinophagales bacterium]
MYAQYRFQTSDKLERNLIVAVLSGFDFNGFEEEDAFINAYVDAEMLDEKEVKQILFDYNLETIPFEYKELPDINWNKEWESQFEPVTIDDVYIRGTFHEAKPEKVEIIIDPKMSFGTGHHPTTALMISEMKALDLNGKDVLDFGSGTGILSIYAAKLGAKKIDAIDHEEWAFNNCEENAKLNNVQNINAIFADDTFSFSQTYPIILANINRPVILNNIENWSKLLNEDATLLLSGLLESDEKDILQKAIPFFKHNFTKQSNGWIVISLSKSK